MAVLQAAEARKRGGGESGSKERGKSMGFAKSMGDLATTGSSTFNSGGITNAMEEIIERSES